MENQLFDQLEMLSQVPTELMTEITDQPKESSLLKDAAKHTETDVIDVLNNPAGQPAPEIKEGYKQDWIRPEMNDYGKQQQPQKMNAANLITGQMAVSFLDMILPVVCVLLIEKINKKKVNKKWLQATPDEKKILEPVLHNYLLSINFNIDNPLNALLITVAFIYGTKTVEVMNDLPQQPQPVKMPDAFARPVKRQRVNETRGRHKLDCQCPKCIAKRNK